MKTKRVVLVAAITGIIIILLLYLFSINSFLGEPARGIVHNPPGTKENSSAGDGKIFENWPPIFGKKCIMVYGPKRFEVKKGDKVWVHIDTIQGQRVAVLDCLRKGNPRGCP